MRLRKSDNIKQGHHYPYNSIIIWSTMLSRITDNHLIIDVNQSKQYQHFNFYLNLLTLHLKWNFSWLLILFINLVCGPTSIDFSLCGQLLKGFSLFIYFNMRVKVNTVKQ